MNRTAVKVTCENGDYWHTTINLSLEEAKKYYFDRVKCNIYENFETGEETRTKIISVEEIKVS